MKESDIKLLSTVREYFKSRSSLAPILSNANETSRKLLKEAFSAIRDKGYSLHLVFITTHKSAPGIDRLIKDTYGFKPGEFSIWHYDYILHLFEEERRDFTPSLGTYPLPYKDADKTMVRTGNYKSWVLTVPLEEIRYLVEKYGDKLFRKNVRTFSKVYCRTYRQSQEITTPDTQSNPKNRRYRIITIILITQLTL